jgi:hypothetical protein
MISSSRRLSRQTKATYNNKDKGCDREWTRVVMVVEEGERVWVKPGGLFEAKPRVIAM